MTAYGDVRLLGNPRTLGEPRPVRLLRPFERPRQERPPQARPRQVRPGEKRIERRPAVAAESRVSRRRLSSPSRAGQRAHPIGRLLAVVLLTFLIGLVYVGQTVHIAAVNYEAAQLAAQRDDLVRQVQTQEASLLRWNAEPMVVERAQRLGLDILTGRIRIAAR
jgi:hypothetical protein